MHRLAALVVVTVAVAALRLTAQDPSPVERLFIEYWEFRLASQPELATLSGSTDYDTRWRDWSREGRERADEQARGFEGRLRMIPQGSLTPSQKISVSMLEYELQARRESEEIRNTIERVTQMTEGPHLEVYRTIDLMPTRTVRDYENILTRLRAVAAFMDQQAQVIQELLEAGRVQPRLVVEQMLEQIDAQTAAPAAETPLLGSFRRFPPAISAVERERLQRAATDVYEQQVTPAWRKFATFLRATYLPKARTNIAISSLPDGVKAYTTLIRAYTTTMASPESIHRLGLQEVDRIEGEMTKIAREGGATSIADYERRLDARADMHYASKDEMLFHARNIAKVVEPELPRLFKRLPRIPFGIRAIPADREAATPSSYTRGTADASRAGFVNLNTYRPERQVRYDLEALLLHEGVPGHHLQNSIALELQGIPAFRAAFASAGYGEGWALYAESLGAELGVYRDAPSRFGQLASERFRAVRLVVDTGMHAFAWPRERALDYFRTHAPAESEAEIDRYIARPGQALAYKLGELKIKELRRKAEQALGSRFDVRQFHDAVLREGRVPLDFLDGQVEAYITAVQAGSSN